MPADQVGTSQMVEAVLQGSRRSQRQRLPVLRSGQYARGMRCWVWRRTPQEVIEAAGNAMQRKTHPDGGSDTDFQKVQEAIQEATSGV